MAKIINVEKSKYLNENIQIYESNKVGQYSKFLEKNPIFLTWLHINSAETRSDVGTGGVNSDVGTKSPIRFNQINNLPVYNIPELKPDVDYAENGYDINIEINDGTLLPNTIKPSVGDYFIITLPNSVELCFRVNAFNYNTIQSNDFYQFSSDLKYTGKDLLDKFKGQIVQEYETIFENIGTDDKCFILTKDVEKIQAIGKLFIELRESYFENFFDRETGTFSCRNNPEDHTDSWLYDKYVEQFIMDSEIYYTENDEHSVILSCADLKSYELNQLYRQTLLYAVLNRTIDYLAPNPYYYQIDIQKPLSPFRIYGIDCKGVNLVLTRNPLVDGHSEMLDNGYSFEYYSHTLIHKLLGVEPTDGDAEESDVESPSNEQSSNKLTYLEELVYQYLINQMLDIDKDKLIKYALQVDNYTYRMMPLVMYIVLQYYNSYFKKEEL